jgi:plasmid stabilization system protein ParE
LKIRYKKTAIEDIQATEEYIRGVLHNGAAAKRLTGRIVQAISLLADNPYMGTPLSGRFDVESDLRYLLVSDHLIFYRVAEESCVEVTRVLNGRQDYISILF